MELKYKWLPRHMTLIEHEDFIVLRYDDKKRIPIEYVFGKAITEEQLKIETGKLEELVGGK
jgi:hypothetical protein